MDYKVLYEMAKPKKMSEGPSGVVVYGTGGGCRVGKSYFAEEWKDVLDRKDSFYCKAAEKGMVPCEEQCFTCAG